MLDQQTKPETTVAEDVTTIATAKPKTRTLYDISTDFADFEQLMETIDEDITSDDAEKLAVWFETLEEERDKKLEATGHIYMRFKQRGESRLEEAKRIERLGKIDLNKAGYLKERVFQFFQFHKITNPIQTLRFKFKKAANGGRLPVRLSAAAETSPVELPEKYRHVIYAPKLEVIREDLERRAAIERTLRALDTMSEIARYASLVNTVGSTLSPEQQAEYDDLMTLQGTFDKKFVEQVTQYDESEVSEMRAEKEDLDALLDGVGELGERGEHMRIS